jgi:hypothetical protein
MANSITSEITISTAVSVLTDLLAPMGNFTLNITNEIVGRQASVHVPIIRTDDVARAYAYSTGYNSNADTDVNSVEVSLLEHIKPFHLRDNDMNKSPLTIQSYAKQNAHEFGRYLLNLLYTKIDGSLESASGAGDGAIPFANQSDVNASSVALSNIQGIQDTLDSNGSPMDRHLVMSSSVNSALMPSSIETFGPGVLQQGRFGNLYGMATHLQTANNTAVGNVHTFGASSDAIIIANRIPDNSGTATLEEYTPFSVEGLGLQCAYRRYYDASKGEHFGAFTTIFGTEIAKGEHIATIARAS